MYAEKAEKKITKETDNWAGILFAWPVSIPLARLFAKFKWIYPNHITLSCIPFGIIAGYMFLIGWLKWGAFFYWLFFMMDGVDGNLARLTNRTSEFGKALDFYTHIVNSSAMYFGLWWSQYHLNGHGLIGAMIIVSHYAVMAFGYLFVKRWTYKTISPRVHSYYSSLEEAFGTFFVAPIFNIVTSLLPILIIASFISFLILFIKQEEKPSLQDMKARIKRKFWI